MLRSLFISLQNQKTNIILVCFAALSMLLFVKIISKYTGTYKSVIATTPATKVANTLLQTVVENYNSSHSWSNFKIYEVNQFNDSLLLQDDETADFAIISPGTAIPNEFEVIASLNEEKVILLSHKGNNFEYLKDIGNTTINIVKINDYDEAVLRKLFDFFDMGDQRNKIEVISLDNFLESKILPNRIVYVFLLNSFSSVSSKIFKRNAQRLHEKCDVIEIDLADLTEHSQVFFPSTIKKGALRIHPLLPNEDIDTVSAFTYLVARISVSEEVVYRLLTSLSASRKSIFDKVSRDAVLSIEGLSDSKTIAFHRSYKKFLNGENESFFQKYSDMIYIAGIALSAVISFIYSRRKKKKTKTDLSYVDMHDLFDYLENNWYGELNRADTEQMLKTKEIVFDFIVKSSNKKNIAVNSLIGFMVLINIRNSLRNKT